MAEYPVRPLANEYVTVWESPSLFTGRAASGMHFVHECGRGWGTIAVVRNEPA